MIDHAAKIVAVDGVGNGEPKIAGAKPGLAKSGDRSGGVHVEPHHFAFLSLAGVSNTGAVLGGKLFELVGVDGGDKIDLSAAEAE